MHKGWGNLQYQHGLGDEQVESSPGEKDLETLVEEGLDMTWQCELAAQKANCVLGCSKGSMAGRAREEILPILLSLDPSWSAVSSSDILSTGRTQIWFCF